MKILIKNANIVSNSINGIKDIYVVDKNIKQISDKIENVDFDDVIDAKKMTVIPGLIDMHAHFREPGFEYKENIETGMEAALHGGVTSVGLMPNTNPVVDNKYILKYLKFREKEIDKIKILPICSITLKEKGEKLSNIMALSENGAVAFSDDGNPVENSFIMMKAMEYSKMIDKPIISHCEEKTISSKGFMREGEYSTISGIYGIPSIAESIMVGRDVEIAKYTGAKLHIAHVSTEASIDIIRNAKKNNVKVTSEVTHNHLLFLDKDNITYNTSTKVNPPLPSKKDLDALVKALKDGTIDIIVTDHAPHSKDEKTVEFQQAPYGISGIETLLSSLILIESKYNINFKELINKVTYNPSKIFNLKNIGDIKEGYRADIVILNKNEMWNVNEKTLKSKGKNTPFLNKNLPGVVKITMVDGKIKYRDDEID